MSSTDHPASPVPERTLERPHGTLAYDLRGPGDAPLVVLAPGLGDLRGEYRELAPRLAAAGWRVASADLRGHGGSSARWPSYTSADVAGDLLALVEALNGSDGAPAVLVGNSFSAGAAVWAATERPAAVAALALVGPFVRDHDVPWYQKAVLAAMFAGPWRVRAWDAYYATLFPTRKPGDLAGHRAALRANLAEPGRFDAVRAMTWRSDAEVAARLPRVKAPTLVLIGSRDPDFPDPAAEARWIAEAVGAGDGGGEVAMIDGAGHYPQTEFPDETAAALLAFLARRVPGAPGGSTGSERGTERHAGGEIGGTGATSRSRASVAVGA